MKKHFFFDMDGTLTRSRSMISDTLVTGLRELLLNGRDVVVVSGATKDQMVKQLGKIMKEVFVMAQNGNHAEIASGEVLWRNELSATQKNDVLKLVHKMIEHADIEIKNHKDLVEDRICQISYSLIGHNAPLEEKEASDPDKEIRKSLFNHFPSEIAHLKKLGVQARIGGTTCVDFTTFNKGENVKKFIEQMGWRSDECIYVGDALFEGGNDYSVVGVIPTCAVSSHIECDEVVRSFINELLV